MKYLDPYFLYADTEIPKQLYAFISVRGQSRWRFTVSQQIKILVSRHSSQYVVGGAILNDVVVHLSNEDLPFEAWGTLAWVFITEENLSMRLRTKSLFFDERQSWMLPFDTHRTALSSRLS